jgi:hypothetical protein
MVNSVEPTKAPRSPSVPVVNFRDNPGQIRRKRQNPQQKHGTGCKNSDFIYPQHETKAIDADNQNQNSEKAVSNT